MATRLRTILYGTTLIAGFALSADVAQSRAGNPFGGSGQMKGGTYKPMPSLRGGPAQSLGQLRGTSLGSQRLVHTYNTPRLGSSAWRGVGAGNALPRMLPAHPSYSYKPPQLGLPASPGNGAGSPRMLPVYPGNASTPMQLGMLPSRWLNGRGIPINPNYAGKPSQFGSVPPIGGSYDAGAVPSALPVYPSHAGASPQPGLVPSWRPAATAVPVMPSLGSPSQLSAPDLGLTPAERKITALRDKLGLESPEDAQGPGTLPNSLGGSSGGAHPGETPQAARDPGCAGAARTLDDPQDAAADGSAAWGNAQRQLRERTEHSRAAREQLAMTRQPGDRNVEHRAQHLPATADRGPVTVVETSWTAADGSRHFLHEEFGIRRRREVTSTGFYYSGSTAGPRSAPQTVYYDGRGNELSRVVRKSQADSTPIIASTDGGNSWELYRDEDSDGRHDGADSQPVDGAADDRDYFCEAGVTNADGPNGSRRNPRQHTRGSDDRNIPDPSGVIIQRDPPPTPEELKRMVTQPGVDGDARSGGGGGGGRRPTDFAQPPVGGPTGQISPRSPDVPGIGLPGPVEAPSIPKPSDPERQG